MYRRLLQFSSCLVLLFSVLHSGQSQNFAFDFKGPDTLLADPICEAILTLHPDSLTVEALVGASVTDTVLTILGGFQLGDTLTPGTVVTFTWMATDDLGNDSTFVFTITVIDGTPPAFSVALPPDVTVTCPNIPNLPAVTIVDNCDDQPILAFTETNTLSSCAGSYTITRTWTATDDAGNSLSHQQVITVNDNSPPALNGVPADITVNCNDIPAPPIIGMDITAVDLCDNNVTIVLTTQNNTGECANSYAIIRTWTASDDCGNAVADSQTITVIDSLPPVLFGIPADMTVACDNIPAPPINGPGGVTAVDNCDSTPDLLRVQSDNQDPDPTQCGHRNYEITRTWIATDDCGNVRTGSQTLAVRDTEAPLLFCPAVDTFVVSTGTCLAEGPLVRSKFISDNCDGGGASILTDTMPILNTSGSPLLSGVVDTVFFDFSFAGVPDQYVTGNINLRINLYNADAEEPGEYYRIYAEGNTLLTQTNPVPVQCANGETNYTLLTPDQINAWSQDDVIRFILIPNGSGVEAINQVCPNGRVSLTLSFDHVVASPAPIQVQYRIDNGPLQNIGTNESLSPGNYSVQVSATDCSGNIGVCTYPLIVVDREAPLLVCPDTLHVPTSTANCAALVNLPFPVNAWDNCGFPTTFDGSVSPKPFVFFEDPNAGMVPADLNFLFSIASPSGPGDGLLRLHVQGDMANPGEFFEIYGENNTFLGITGPVTIPQECASEAIFTFTIPEPLLKAWTANGQVDFRLVSNKDILNYSDFINPCGPLQPNSTDGLSHAWLELIYSSIETDYTVVNNATNQQVGAGILKYPSTANLLNLNAGSYTANYTLTDADGNSSTCSYPIYVEDRTPPTIICKPGLFRKTNPSGLVNLTLSHTDLLTVPGTDNCGITQYQVTPNTFTCNNAGSNYNVQVVAFDLAGNSDTCSTLIAIQNEELTPSFTLDTCGGSLRLIPDTTFTIPTPGQGDFYVYTWTSSNGFFSNQASPIIDNPKESNSGTYVLTIQGLTGCMATGSVQIDIGPNGAFRPSIHSNSPVCQGDTIHITTEWQQAMTYQWTHQQTGQVFTTTTPELFAPALLMNAGTWTLQVFQTPNCPSDVSLPLPVIIHPINVQLPDSLLACDGDTLILPVNGVNVVKFTWTAPNGKTYIGSTPKVPAIPGTYYLVAENPQGCTTRDSLRIVLTERPKITALSSSCPTCVSGFEDCQILPTVFPPEAGGSYQYFWTGPNGMIFSLDSVAQLLNVTGAQSGLYSLKVKKVDNTCTSVPATIFIAMDDTPVTPVIMVDDPAPKDPYEICAGETLVIHVPNDPYGGDVKYIWMGPLKQDTTLFPTLTIPGITINQGGKYKLKVIVDGCISNQSNEITVIVHPIPFPPAITTNSPVCAGDTLIACATFVAGAVYEWQGPITNQTGGNCLVLPNATTNLTGSYQVRILMNGCYSPLSEEFFQQVKSNPLPPVVSDDCGGLICAQTPGNCQLTLTGGLPGGTYGWYDGNTDTLIGNSGIQPFLPLDLPGQYKEGKYDFYAITTVDGCRSVPSVIHTIQINTIPNQIANAGPDVTICNGQVLELCGQSPTIGTGQWQQTAGTPVTLLTPDANCTKVNGYLPGDQLIFSWTLSNGACKNYSTDFATAAISVTVQAMVDSPLELCRAKGTSITAINPAPNSGMWSQTMGQAGLGVTILSPSQVTTAITDIEPGNAYFFTWTVDNGACPPTSASVEVFNFDDHAYAGVDRQDCGYGCLSMPLTADFTELGSGRWSSLVPGVLIDSLGETSAGACNLQPGFNAFIWELNHGICGASSRDTVVVNYEYGPSAANDTMAIPFAGQSLIQVLTNDAIFGPVTTQLLTQPLVGQIEKVADGIYRYTAPANYSGTVTFRYQVCSEKCPGVCAEAIVVLKIGLEPRCEMPTIITPNNDGVNDILVIPCLVLTDEYPDNRLSIFNQWGDEVYAASPYLNSWAGTYGGQILPPGTYFYILDLQNGELPESGFLLIKY
ncbi:MAG: gliding motility-associated C-terminal domain-containing protein [Saprospiraceae bacterium]|nr:gliding motility-associated C-terminal domain-containing protein [Saprospiraceae bacterium]